MDDPFDTENNELSVSEGAFWHINMDLYYGYQVGEIVEVEHEPNKYWLASIYYSFKHLVLLRWIGNHSEFWVDTSAPNLLQSSSSFSQEHASPKRLYPLGYHSQFHTRSQYDLVKPTKFLEKPTLYNPSCDPYGGVHTIDDLLAHDSDLNDRNSVFRTPEKLNESMDLVIANRKAKVTFGQEDAEELAAALQNLDAIDAIANGDSENVQTSDIEIDDNDNKKHNLPTDDNPNKDEKLAVDVPDSGISSRSNDSKCIDKVLNGQLDSKSQNEEVIIKQESTEKTEVNLDAETYDLCKSLIQTATTKRMYNGIGDHKRRTYQVKPKQLYDVGGANHERVFVPGTMLEVCYFEDIEGQFQAFQWFAVVLRNTGGRLTLRWFICDEPKFRQGRLELKSIRSEFIRNDVDQDSHVESEEVLDDKRLPSEAITFSKHFCNPCVQTIAQASSQNYSIPRKIRSLLAENIGNIEVDAIQRKLIDAVHDERRKSLDKDRPIIDHILDTARKLKPNYIKLNLGASQTKPGHEVLISSPTSTKLLRGFVKSELAKGVYEIQSVPLPDTGEIIRFAYPHDSSYTVLPIDWGSSNKDCLSAAPSRVPSPCHANRDKDESTILAQDGLSSDQAGEKSASTLSSDAKRWFRAMNMPGGYWQNAHFVNDGVTNWCLDGSHCEYCPKPATIDNQLREETECKVDERFAERVAREFKVMDRLEVAHPSSNITICSGRIRKVVYPLLWIQISPDSYTLLPFNSTEIYPFGWCHYYGHSSISLLPPVKRINRNLEDKKRKRQKVSDDSDSEHNSAANKCAQNNLELDAFDLGKLCDKQIDIDYILNEKSKYITIYFNHKCFTGPALSKGKICSLPQYVGPGPLRLVMEEVITKVISVAYVPPRILNDLSSKGFKDLLKMRNLINTTPMEFKAKYQKRVHREDVQVCIDVDDVPLYCECVCEYLKCCYNLFSPELYDGDDCPGHCRVLTKSNKFMKRATYYREKARLGEFTSDNGNKKKATSNNNNNNNNADNNGTKSTRPIYNGRGSSESTSSSSLSRNEQVNSRASSNGNEVDDGQVDYKENQLCEGVEVEGEMNTEKLSAGDNTMITKNSYDDKSQLAINDNIDVDNNDESLAAKKVTFHHDKPSNHNEGVQLQSKLATRVEQLFNEFDRLAIDSDLINQWTINDLREYLKCGQMDKFVPIVVTEHIDGEALLLLDDSAIRELFQHYFTRDFTREEVDRFCHFVEYVKFKARSDTVQLAC